MMRHALLFTLVVGAAACSDKECDARDVADCTCEDGASGTKTCRADGSWGACDCPSLAPTALTEVPPPGELIDPGFPFLEGTDEVSQAMRSLWEHGMRAPATSEEKSAAMAAKAEALATIQSNLPDVQAELLTALQSIEGDNVSRYRTLMPLLRFAGGSSPILTHFQGIAMGALTAAEQEVTHDPSPAEQMRGLAMQVLARQAKRGSAVARAHVRRGVTSPAVGVRKDAVRYYYQIERNRRLAQRELRTLMSPEDRHLLYLY